MSKKQSKTFRQRISNALELPEEVVLKTLKTTIMGTESVTVENYKGIIAYDEELIKVKTDEGIMSVGGRNLTINTVTDSDIFISGEINSIRWE